MISPVDFMHAPELAGASFAGETRKAQEAVLAAAFGLPMDEEQAELFERLGGGRRPLEGTTARELWVVAGRRSDKSHTFGAGLATYFATVYAEASGLLEKLAPGETGVVALIAVDRSQARVVMDYVRGILEASPVLSKMIRKMGREFVELNNRTRLEVFTNNFRTVRGRTLLFVCLDEVAYFRDDTSASPDFETYRAAVPALATTGGMLVGVSSPYARRGLLWSKYAKHYGRDGDVVVVQGGSRDFNPLLPQQLIDDHMAEDPEAARAEWLGEFRSDLEQFLALETVERAVRHGPEQLPYDRRVRYQAFTDPSGGGPDSFTLAIAHKHEERWIVDLLLARKGAPAPIVEEFAKVLKAYGLATVTGDRYGGQWPAQEFARHSITYKVAELPKSELYLAALPSFTSGRVEIPNDQRLINQLTALERRTSRGGRDSIDHPARGHDDLANAVCGVIASKPPHRPTSSISRYRF